jgi:hypothetical protein
MTAPLHRLAVGLALAVWTSPAIAQSRPDASETKASPAGGSRPDGGFNPLGDTARFTRMGGWGGMGSGMAQFGMAKTMLLMTPAVQKELKLSESQIKALHEWGDGLRKRGESMFRRQAQDGNAGDPTAPAGAPPGLPGPPPGPPPEGGPPPNPMAMIELISTLTREGESGLAKILDKKQLARLNQIALQMEGAAALARTEVAEAIYLSPEQVAEIQEILSGAKVQQMGLFVRQGFAMRDRRDANADPGKPQSGQDNPVDPEAQAKRRQAQRERMRTEFTKFRDSSDQIHDATTAKILRVLDKKQRGRFEKLLGEPFDPSKLAGPGGFGGPGRPDAAPAEAKAADAAKPSETAPARSSRLRDSRFKGEPKAQP